VITTIQPRLQVAADQLLGERPGAILVMEPDTGAILALASHPTYDPNTYDENAESLVVDPEQPTLNRATRGLYTPGSVFKVVTLAGALQQGIVTMDGEYPLLPYDQSGIWFIEGFPIREGSSLPYENRPFDLAHALAYSSNVAFAQFAVEMGAQGLRDIAEALGLESEPPLRALSTEPSRLGTDAFLLDQVGLANTGYGQGQLLMTPLHMALVTAAVANEGVIPEPRLVTEVRSREGDTVATFPPRPWKQALSRGVAANVKQAMIISATDGFARAGQPEGISIGGKTGTAQLGGTESPHAWFMAFAPADVPEVVVVVIVENAGAGGDIAAPIARQLIQLALTE
jgi:peptidoglycan glycosyltransferase